MITTVVLVGSWSSPDGGIAYGSLTLSLLAQLLDSATSASVPSGTVQVPLDQNGNLTFQVAATDDPTTEPVNASYLASLEIIGSPDQTSYIMVPHSPPGSRTVADLVGAVGQNTVTSATAAFTGGDVGKWVSGPGIPYYTKIQSVQTSTGATLSQALTATLSASTLVIGASVSLAALMAA